MNGVWVATRVYGADAATPCLGRFPLKKNPMPFKTPWPPPWKRCSSEARGCLPRCAGSGTVLPAWVWAPPLPGFVGFGPQCVFLSETPAGLTPYSPSLWTHSRRELSPVGPLGTRMGGTKELRVLGLSLNSGPKLSLFHSRPWVHKEEGTERLRGPSHRVFHPTGPPCFYLC